MESGIPVCSREPVTWRMKSGIIMFHLTVPSSGDPVLAMRSTTIGFVAQLPAIGPAFAMTVSTRADGEDAHEWTGEMDMVRVSALLRAHSDLTGVLLTCDALRRRQR